MKIIMLERQTKTQPEVHFMKLDLDIEVEEEDMFIDGMFAEPEKFAQDLYIQRLLNSSVR